MIVELVTFVDSICLSNTIGLPSIQNDIYVLSFLIRAKIQAIVYFEHVGANASDESCYPKSTFRFVGVPNLLPFLPVLREISF